MEQYSRQGISYLHTNPSDEFYTPLWAVKILDKYLKKNSVIWCPFDTEGSNYVSHLRNMGFKVIHSHINEGGTSLI